MGIVLRPGPPAGRDDAARARARHQSLRDELTRVRTAATAWRNGLAGLLAALVGFGLIKGRTEIDKVGSPWRVVIGVLLLAALLAGAAGALWLLRAANGAPRLTPVDPALSPVTQDHLRALAGLADLRRGIIATLLCAALLVTAVAVTWYGPEKSPLKLRVELPGAVLCGSGVGISQGELTLSTKAGRVTVDTGELLTIQPVETCP